MEDILKMQEEVFRAIDNRSGDVISKREMRELTECYTEHKIKEYKNKVIDKLELTENLKNIHRIVSFVNKPAETAQKKHR